MAVSTPSSENINQLSNSTLTHNSISPCNNSSIKFSIICHIFRNVHHLSVSTIHQITSIWLPSTSRKQIYLYHPQFVRCHGNHSWYCWIILRNYTIIQTSVSVSQMLKGSVLFFTYLITLFYLKQNLSIRKHLYMLAILVSLTLIGISNLSNSNPKCKYQYIIDESNPLLGNSLIVLSQLLFSLMFIYEYKIL